MDIEEALKHSSLGTAEARRLAEQIPSEVAQSILDRSKATARRPGAGKSRVSRVSSEDSSVLNAALASRNGGALSSVRRVAVWVSGVLAMAGLPFPGVAPFGAHASLQAVGLSFSRDMVSWRTTRRLSSAHSYRMDALEPFAWNVADSGAQAVPVWAVQWVSSEEVDFDNLALVLIWQNAPLAGRRGDSPVGWDPSGRVPYVRFREIGSMKQAMVLPALARSRNRSTTENFVDAESIISLFERWLGRRPRVSRMDQVALAVRADLAGWYGVGGDPSRAVAEYQELLADQVALFGNDHVSTLAVRANLAAWRGVSGDVSLAVADYRSLLECHVRLRGEDDPVTSAARADYVCWVKADGDVGRVSFEYKRFLSTQPQHEVVTSTLDPGTEESPRFRKQKKS